MTLNFSATGNLSQGYKLLVRLLWDPALPNVVRRSSGLIMITNTGVLCKYLKANTTYLKQALVLMETSGLIKHLTVEFGRLYFYVVRPLGFEYTKTQYIPTDGIPSAEDLAVFRAHKFGRPAGSKAAVEDTSEAPPLCAHCQAKLINSEEDPF